MKRSRIATAEDLKPLGMQCPTCSTEIKPGDEYVEFLEGMVDDIPLTLCGVCPTCAEKWDTLVDCPTCAPAANPQEQCQTCGGFGMVFA